MRAVQRLLDELGHDIEGMAEMLHGPVAKQRPLAGVPGARHACNRPGQPRPRRQGTTRQPLDPDPFTNGGRFWSNSCRIALLPGESSQPVTADEIDDWMTKCAILTSLLEGVEDVKAVMRKQEFVDQYNEIDHIQNRILTIMSENDCLPPLKDEDDYEMDDFP